MIVWTSTTFSTFNTIPEQDIQITEFYNSGNLFHSLAHLYGLKFRAHDLNRSIFSNDSNIDPYPYIINSNNNKVDYFKLADKE